MIIFSPAVQGCEGFFFGFQAQQSLSDLPQISVVKNRSAQGAKHPVTLCLGVSYTIESIKLNSVSVVQTQNYTCQNKV